MLIYFMIKIVKDLITNLMSLILMLCWSITMCGISEHHELQCLMRARENCQECDNPLNQIKFGLWRWWQ